MSGILDLQTVLVYRGEIKPMSGLYYVYIVECSDKSLYCGWAVDLEKRLREHNEGKKGARYTRSRRPVTLVYSESFATRSEAMRREYTIKAMTRAEKLLLAGGSSPRCDAPSPVPS